MSTKCLFNVISSFLNTEAQVPLALSIQDNVCWQVNWETERILNYLNYGKTLLTNHN